MEDGEEDVVKTGWNSVSAETDLLFDKMIAKLWDQAAKASLASGKRVLTTGGIQKGCRDLFKVHRRES